MAGKTKGRPRSKPGPKKVSRRKAKLEIQPASDLPPAAHRKLPFDLDRIHQVDCIEALVRLPAGSVDLVFADPPFNIGYEYDEYDDNREHRDYLAWSQKWIKGVYHALKADGTFWLAIGDEYAAELKVAAQEIGFTCRSWVVWYYTFGVNCKVKFTRSHTHLFYFVKDPNRFTFQSETIRIPSARQLVYGDARANPKGRLPDDTWILRPQDCVDGFLPDEDTWYFPRVAGTFKERAGFHGCQMPEQLLGRIIRACSLPGELVLDPFAGSGVTLIVAKKLARASLGFELSADYARRGQVRLAAASPGDPLVGAAEPLLSAPQSVDYQVPKGRVNRVSQGMAANSAPLADEAPPAARILRADHAENASPQDDPESPAAMLPAGKASSESAALIAAFAAASQGYSLDRLVADPDLNRQFLAACRKAGLTGAPADLNRALFRLRKKGALSHLHSARRTEYDWPTLDKFLFASEIAWRSVTDGEDFSLDDLLCDPQRAARLDRVAANFAPGFKPLDYRWAALRLRKEAKLARQRSLSLEIPVLGQPVPAQQAARGAAPAQEGVYLVCDKNESPIYAGCTLDLAQRFKRHFSAASLEAWQRLGPGLVVRFVVCHDSDESAHSVVRLLAMQHLLVAQFRPSHNILHPTADD